MYNPTTNASCVLPNLPDHRVYHTQDGSLICGGEESATDTDSDLSCLKWSIDSGTWNKSHSLTTERDAHISWETCSGLYLIGGLDSWSTSTLLLKDGSQEKGFNLKDDFQYFSDKTDYV